MDEGSKESSGEGQSQEPEAAKREKHTSETPVEDASAAALPHATPAEGASAGGTPAESAASADESDAQRIGAAGESTLPVVWSPKLGGDEISTEETLQSAGHEDMHTSDEAHDEKASPDNTERWPTSRSLRFILVAVSFAAAAAVGSFIGSLSATGVERLWPAAAPAVATTRSASAHADVASLKANLDAVTRGANGQFAKLAERLDRLERAQAEPAAKIARLSESVDRLEKKNAALAAAAAAPETTGSIASAAPAAGDAKAPDKVLPDWIVREARAGRALLENRYGGLFDVTAGSVLPGLGRVESVKRQEGQWVVVTAHGTIYSAP